MVDMRTNVVIFLCGVASMVAGTIVHEVNVGEIAVLPCPSNDDSHRFQYWQLVDDQVIGPGNKMNQHKYHYDVLTGKLYIKSVSTGEAGFYQCISKHIVGQGLSIEKVELIVKKDWEDVFEEDDQVNTYRAVIGVLVILIILLVGGFAFLIKRRRSQNIIDITREESPDENMVQSKSTRTYNPTTLPVPSTSRGKINRPTTDRVLDNAIVDTDIRTSFSLPDFD